MIKSTPFYIGCRYILAKKGSRFISFTSLMSMAGLTLGVLALVIVLSVFNGSQGIMRDRTLITVPHGELSTNSNFSQWQSVREQLLENSHVEAVAPFINLEAMISERGYHQVAQIKGVLPELETDVSQLSDHLFQGSLLDLKPGGHGIVLARALAGSLRVNTGDTVNLILPELGANGQRLNLNQHRFTVVGIFDVQFSIGSNLAYIHLDDSAEISGLTSSSETLKLRLKFDDIHQAKSILKALLSTLESQYTEQQFFVKDWSESEASLFNALKMEKLLTSFMLMMIVAIGAFNIISTLVMMVSDKQADIAILRTMGASERTILGIFMVQGSLIGIVGTLAGALSGIIVVLNFDLISGFLSRLLSPADTYIISALPAELQWPDVYYVCLSALLISFIATLYPAWRASQIQPAEVLRYE